MLHYVQMHNSKFLKRNPLVLEIMNFTLLILCLKACQVNTFHETTKRYHLSIYK